MDVLKSIEQIKHQLDEIYEAIHNQEFKADAFSESRKKKEQEMICNTFVEQRQWKNTYQAKKAKQNCMFVMRLLSRDGLDFDSIAFYPAIKRLCPRNRAVVQDFIDYLRVKENQ